MELEVGRKYKIRIKSKTKVIKVVKKNTRNCIVKMDNCNELLWTTKQGMYFRELQYSFDDVECRVIKWVEKIKIEVIGEI